MAKAYSPRGGDTSPHAARPEVFIAWLRNLICGAGPRGAPRRVPAAAILAALAALLLAGCGATAFSSEAAAEERGDSGAAVVRTAVAVRSATARAAATAEALALAERQRAEGTAQARRLATVSAQVFLVETTSAERALRQTAAVAATAAAAPTPRPTATAEPPTAEPTAAAAGEQAQLRFVKLNEDDDPACITVAIRGIATAGWSFRVDGTRLAGRFDRAGNARACGLGRRQEITFTVFNAAGRAVAGGSGVPSRGSAIMRGAWR